MTYRRANKQNRRAIRRLAIEPLAARLVLAAATPEFVEPPAELFTAESAKLFYDTQAFHGDDTSLLAGYRTYALTDLDLELLADPPVGYRVITFECDWSELVGLVKGEDAEPERAEEEQGFFVNNLGSAEGEGSAVASPSQPSASSPVVVVLLIPDAAGQQTGGQAIEPRVADRPYGVQPVPATLQPTVTANSSGGSVVSGGKQNTAPTVLHAESVDQALAGGAAWLTLAPRDSAGQDGGSQRRGRHLAQGGH